MLWIFTYTKHIDGLQSGSTLHHDKHNLFELLLLMHLLRLTESDTGSQLSSTLCESNLYGNKLVGYCSKMKYMYLFIFLARRCRIAKIQFQGAGIHSH